MEDFYKARGEAAAAGRGLAKNLPHADRLPILRLVEAVGPNAGHSRRLPPRRDQKPKREGAPK